MAFSDEMEIDSDKMSDDLATKSSGVRFADSDGEDEDGTPAVIQSKIPFKERVNPFVGPKDQEFLRIENYFFSLLRSSGISIDDILEGTFDAHEIFLVTPQSGPPDIVDWQRRNAHRYYENLQTRFKGHPDTLAFKMACLYFGLPVEPLRTGTMAFPLPPDSDSLDVREAGPSSDPLNFLEKYGNQDQLDCSERSMKLRGGGDFRYSTYMANKEAVAGKSPGQRQRLQRQNEKQWPGVTTGGAIQEISPDGYEMGVEWLDSPASGVQVESLHAIKPATSASRMRLYGWQGVVNMANDYADFVHQVDRLLSNQDRRDRYICVEIWRVTPVQLIETVKGTIRHHRRNPPADDPLWELVQKYFNNGSNHACFVRLGEGNEPGRNDRAGGYQPLSSDRTIVRIENRTDGEVAYMRIPTKLKPDHKAHQFSMDYMLVMQFLLPPGSPHAWVSYQNGHFGETYQHLDPPGPLWDMVIDSHSEWKPTPIVFFALNKLDDGVVTVMVPGVFTSRALTKMNRKDFELTNSDRDVEGLKKLYKAVKSQKQILPKQRCVGFEVWCPASAFKNVAHKPMYIGFPGGTHEDEYLQDWREFLSAGVVPEDEGFCLVARPVYETYYLGRAVGEERAKIAINQYPVEAFRNFVRDELYRDYDTKDVSRAITLRSWYGEASQQPEVTIRHDTTEEEWQWIRRNIIESELTVAIEQLDNEWFIPMNRPWGSQYTARNGVFQASMAQPAAPTMPRGLFNTGIHTARVKDETGDPSVQKEKLDFVFRNSRNNTAEATRMQVLRDRSFTTIESIFTNPLKPVMPLYGPPLESVIKTGPGMPGVSIAMMTPTEMARLQREVHSLRFQLLDRTRECPYADCDRYFAFADGEGLDRHVREEHNVLRCFLCDKDQHLLPYYNQEQIREHFAREHVVDILKTYGLAAGTKKDAGDDNTEARPRAGPKAPQRRGVPKSEDSDSDNMREDTSDSLNPRAAHPKRPTDEVSESEFIIEFSENPWEAVAKAMENGQNPWRDPSVKLPQRTARGKKRTARRGPVPAAARRPPRPAPIAVPARQGTEDSELPTIPTPPAAAAGGSPSQPQPQPQQQQQQPAQTPVTAGGNRRKRRRPGAIDTTYSPAGSGSEAYEYSEKSAVPDPLADLVEEGAPAPSPKKQRNAVQKARTPARIPAAKTPANNASVKTPAKTPAKTSVKTPAKKWDLPSPIPLDDPSSSSEGDAAPGDKRK
ncbi:hypothetical protein F4802DRAFT_620316 [Xylaria palmicola]|nr:hypothetical protein F4802DRAFT_620316 [Xylaria palmicola]